MRTKQTPQTDLDSVVNFSTIKIGAWFFSVEFGEFFKKVAAHQALGEVHEEFSIWDNDEEVVALQFPPH
jgi:hypothetical protein